MLAADLFTDSRTATEKGKEESRGIAQWDGESERDRETKKQKAREDERDGKEESCPGASCPEAESEDDREEGRVMIDCLR